MSERRCPNCDEPALGEYCHACGQRHGELLPRWQAWVLEALDELLLVEARLPRTVISLFRHPGEQTAEWWQGRRAKYVSPIRLYLLIAVPFFLFFSTSVRDDGRESFLEYLVSIPMFEDSPDYLAPLGPLPPELHADSAARSAWQADFDRIQAHNASIRQGLDRQYDQGVGRVFDILPVVVALTMVPLLALLLQIGEGRDIRFVGRLVLSLHLHTVLYAASLIGAVFGGAMICGAVGVAGYLTLARRRLFEESWFLATALSMFTVPAYALGFLTVFSMFVMGLGSVAPEWVYGSL